MAIRVAELAGAGMTPDWMQGAVPRRVPVGGEAKPAWGAGRHRRRQQRTLPGARKWRAIEILACPVTFSPHPRQIEAARRAYVDWWQALDG